MKKFLITIICFSLIILTMFNADKISNYIASKLSFNPTLIIKEKSKYAKSEGFSYISVTDNFVPYSYEDLKSIIYSTINNGWNTFTFYCPSEYAKCISDIEKISNDSLTLTHISNFVHPFNSFTSLNTTIYESGEITLTVDYLYEKEQIEAVDKKIDEIINANITDDLSDYDKIKVLHDYIINNTKYDENANSNKSTIPSYLAYGALFFNIATCNGYSDVMAIMLTKLGIKNYKIATTKEDISYESTGHVWNAAYIDGKWLHLDLTWDDPVSSDGKDYLYHKYFLVTTSELNEADSGNVKIEEHNFNKSIYLEFNESIKELIS